MPLVSDAKNQAPAQYPTSYTAEEWTAMYKYRMGLASTDAKCLAQTCRCRELSEWLESRIDVCERLRR